MTGKTHSEETLTQMSISQQLVSRSARSGENNPMFGRTGANHPMSGKVASFAKWLGVSEGSVRNYIRSGKEFKGRYLLSLYFLNLLCLMPRQA